MDVSIVIVNYNTRDLLSDCLDSIRVWTKGIDYEVLVSDNDSRDGSLERLARDYPWVRVVANGANLGFGTGNNRGAAQARGRYLFFLNSDTILLNNAVAAFFDFAEASPLPLGVLGCVLKNARMDQANSFGYYPSYGGMLADRVGNFVELLKGGKPIVFEDVLEVDFVTGAAMFIRRDAFEAIQGFDEDFFLYYEETDLQRRLRAGGLRHFLITGPGIQHLEGGSGKARMGSRILSETSMYRYFAKHRGRGALLWVFYLAFSLSAVFTLPRYKPRDNFRYIRFILRDIPRLLRR